MIEREFDDEHIDKLIKERKQHDNMPILIPGMDKAIIAFTPGQAIYSLVHMAEIYMNTPGLECSFKWANAKLEEQWYNPHAPWNSHINPANAPIIIQWWEGEINEAMIKENCGRAADIWEKDGRGDYGKKVRDPYPSMFISHAWALEQKKVRKYD